MKKIIAIAITAICLVSASFALDLEFGARAILGSNLDPESSLRDSAITIKDSDTFDFGFGAYGNFALFGGLGIQAEANYIKSSITFLGDKDGSTEEMEYDLHTLDLSPMVWLNLDLWKLTIGFGAGPNFSIVVPDLQTAAHSSKTDFVTGLIVGADFKFYITDHLGLVLSGRYIMEWQKSNYVLEAYGQSVDTNVPIYDPTRKTIYGGLGIEYKLF